MILGLGLSLANSRPLGGFDPDAAAYFARATVTDETAQNNINAFIVGLKAQGLWNSVYEIHIMRSAYNRGTGATVYGLKGTFDFSATGTPTWGTTGITYVSASNQYLSATISKQFSAAYFFTLVRYTSTTPGNSRTLDILEGANMGGLWAPFNDGNMYWDCLRATSRTSGAAAPTANQFHAYSGSSNGIRCWKDKTSVGGTTPAANLTSTYTTVQFGRANITASLNGIGALSVMIESGLSQAQHEAVYDLVKSTIGDGLAMI